MLQSHRRAVTVLFSVFTAFSEISEPEEVMLVLREYHTAMGVLVDKFEDTVERFVGDGLLVIFNVPVPCPDPSIRAMQMAVEMRECVAYGIQQATRWRSVQEPSLVGNFPQPSTHVYWTSVGHAAAVFI